MDEVKLNACAAINNKQNYLPSYFLLNLVLEITWAKNNSLRKIVNKFKDKFKGLIRIICFICYNFSLPGAIPLT